MVRRYVPESGDIVWLYFDPQAGHEQAGHRPAVVLSPSSYNHKTGLMLCCPMTTQVKGYPFEVEVAGERLGAVLADQVKSLDWKARKAEFKGKLTPAELSAVRIRAIALIGEP
ncbi:endoribonuclease MazF [Pseudomonas corrugata]|uniref:endoribonuclease MazF n=1 Tax=Pseudomonas corrugata TaxID=47879 RepID=UPI0018E5EA4E|nr:endoribonuclease MazF [Pseudomonas corrugata]MBI6621542.1 endoribonuclease MazF [Pseudomonas corrugata]MBI6694223.1 endoribonuclease MazF [Pseudomonas corrugata]